MSQQQINMYLGPRQMDDKTPDLTFPIALTAVVAGAIAMGVSPVFVRFAEVGPFTSAFWRVFLALPFLFVWMWLELPQARKKLFQWTDIFKLNKPIFCAGLFFAGDLLFWHLSILETTIANATLLACLAPVWVALLSGLVIGEPVTRASLFGLAFCLVGAGALMFSSFSTNPERLSGDIYGLLTSIFFGLYFLAVRVARRKQSAGEVVFKSTLVTSLVLFIAALLLENVFWPESSVGILALIALGLISHTGGQGLLALALGSLTAAFGSLVIFVEAVAGAFMGWLVFSEALTGAQWFGSALILGGIWIARPRKETKAK